MAGFTTAFATVAIAGIGDKSFWTALILAAKHKARWVFTGSMTALTLGTALWIGLGIWISQYIAIHTIQLVSGTTFLFFGCKALAEGFQHHRNQRLNQDKLNAESTTRDQGILSANAIIRDSFTTTFIAEFGDRTQLALLALAAGPNMSIESIFSGAVLANTLLVIAAVTAGKYLKELLCQKKIAFLSGSLFIAIGIKILAG